MIAHPSRGAISTPAATERRAAPVDQHLEQTEAYQTLLARAQRRTGPIPASLLVRHVLSVTRDADWPVQREALEALLRRRSFAHRDDLVIASRPAARAVLGPYTTRRKGSSARPYQTVLESVEPPRGACNCPDFLRSSLGLCKHLLVVLEDIAAKPRRLDRAVRDSRSLNRQQPVLRWNPVRPLTGPGDLMGQIEWVGGQDVRLENRAGRAARRWFRQSGRRNLTLKETVLAKPAQRRAAIEDLLAVTTSKKSGKSLRDPALIRLLEIERSRSEHDMSRAGRGIATSLRGLKRKLYPYQREGVKRFLDRGRLLLADDMGLGKTAQAVASCHALWRSGGVRRGLLVVPASLKSQWEREWRLFSDAPVTVVDGGPVDRNEIYRTTRRGFLIGNYEQVVRDLESLHRWGPELMVLDEAQRIKNWATKTAACVKAL